MAIEETHEVQIDECFTELLSDNDIDHEGEEEEEEEVEFCNTNTEYEFIEEEIPIESLDDEGGIEIETIEVDDDFDANFETDSVIV